MANKKLTDATVASKLYTTDYVLINQGNTVKQASYDALLNAISGNEDTLLQQTAFYTEPNTASSKGAKYINVGGNDAVRQAFAAAPFPVLLDPQTGCYCRLNPNAPQYTADGTQVYDGSAVTSGWENAEWMVIVPEYYQFVQDAVIGGTTYPRVWRGYSALPGGVKKPTMCTGMFKAYVASSKMHSRPGVVPSNNTTVYNFWQQAQNLNKDCGLAGIDHYTYMNSLLHAKTAYRSVQEAKDSGGSLIYGVGLDGTENTTSSTAIGFDRQKSVKTGATLTLAGGHGNVAVTDSAGGTCHSAVVGFFENPYAQYWEFVGDLCSLASDSENRVVHMLENTMPKNSSGAFLTAPTLDDFAGLRYELLTRASAGDKTLVDAANQVYAALPQGSLSGVDDGDGLWYNATGQVWIWGGRSDHGAGCGLGFSYSNLVWTSSDAYFSARLAYFGGLTEVSAAKLKSLLSA